MGDSKIFGKLYNLTDLDKYYTVNDLMKVSGIDGLDILQFLVKNKDKYDFKVFPLIVSSQGSCYYRFKTNKEY